MERVLHSSTFILIVNTHSCTFSPCISLRWPTQAFVQYTFNNKPHPIIQKPHNTKNVHAQPFISTLQKPKQHIKEQPPKQAVASVTKQKGGIVKLNAVGDLPCNWKQAYNITLSIMSMCMGKGDDRFVCIVTLVPEPMCVLSTDSTFWYRMFQYRLLHLFHLVLIQHLTLMTVTVTSYQNLLKNCTTGQNHVMIGPMLVHRRNYSTLSFLCFELGVFRDNCKAKLQQMSIQNEITLDILQAILGSFLKGKGLVDTNDRNDLRYRLQLFKAGSTSTWFLWVVC